MLITPRIYSVCLSVPPGPPGVYLYSRGRPIGIVPDHLVSVVLFELDALIKSGTFQYLGTPPSHPTCHFWDRVPPALQHPQDDQEADQGLPDILDLFGPE